MSTYCEMSSRSTRFRAKDGLDPTDSTNPATVGGSANSVVGSNRNLHRGVGPKENSKFGFRSDVGIVRQQNLAAAGRLA